jgi:hypothetical protein
MPSDDLPGPTGRVGDEKRAIMGEHNVYGAPPGTGISMPPYFLPTPSVKNHNNYFPQSEPTGPDEMRIIFMGSQPWPPRLDQAGTCIMLELGNGKRFFFDFSAIVAIGAPGAIDGEELRNKVEQCINTRIVGH